VGKNPNQSKELKDN